MSAENNLDIPEDVVNTPPGPGGNGFVLCGVYCAAIVGSDGEIYVRKDGVISVDETPPDEDGA